MKSQLIGTPLSTATTFNFNESVAIMKCCTHSATAAAEVVADVAAADRCSTVAGTPDLHHTVNAGYEHHKDNTNKLLDRDRTFTMLNLTQSHDNQISERDLKGITIRTISAQVTMNRSWIMFLLMKGEA